MHIRWPWRCIGAARGSIGSAQDSLVEINALAERLAAAVRRYEDEPQPAEDPLDVANDLTEALARYEHVSIRINRTNNVTRLVFDGREMTLMEAIAVRERLTLEAKARRGAVEAIEDAFGLGRNARRAWLAGRRSKDDVRQLPTVELRKARQAADDVSEAVRRLDIALQQRNWTTQLLGEG